MKTYSVMLEGTDAGMGYFINVEVVASNPTRGVKLAEERARELGLTIVGVEEVTETARTNSSEPKILSISGKSYFPTGD